MVLPRNLTSIKRKVIEGEMVVDVSIICFILPFIYPLFLQEDVYFRVNYEKFGIHMRNSVCFVIPFIYQLSSRHQVIVAAVKDRFNSGASIVMKAALKATEPTQLSVLEPRSG